MEQLIISIGREYGSAGHAIGEILSKRFGLEFCDRSILDDIASHKNIDVKELEKYDELPKKAFLSRKVRGYSNSPEENIAQMQFGYLKNKADKGDSFVVVGRCAESVLDGNKGLISIFISADRDWKIEHIMSVKNLSREEAIEKMNKHDKTRKAYHNHFAKGKWGDSRNYDMTINSSKLDIEGTADMLEEYIRRRMEKNS